MEISKELTAQELYDWAVENRIYRWELPMLIKINENKIKDLSKEQIDAIIWFATIVSSQKFFQGHDPVIRVSSFNDCIESIKAVRKKITNKTGNDK